MNRTNKGSITVEAIVMLGLIATLTPILYKHVAERRARIYKPQTEARPKTEFSVSGY